MFYEGRIEDLEVTFIDQIDRLGRDHLAETRRLQNLLREKKQELEQVCESFQRQKTLLEAKIKQLREERSALAREVESERSVCMRSCHPLYASIFLDVAAGLPDGRGIQATRR